MSKYPPFDEYMKKIKDAEKLAAVSQVGTNDTTALCKIIANLFLVLNQDFKNSAYGSAYIVGLRLVTVCAVLLPESAKFRSEDPSIQSQIAAATSYAKQAVEVCGTCKERIRVQYEDNVKAILAVESAQQLAEQSRVREKALADAHPGLRQDSVDDEIPWATSVPVGQTAEASYVGVAGEISTNAVSSGHTIPVAEPVMPFKDPPVAHAHRPHRPEASPYAALSAAAFSHDSSSSFISEAFGLPNATAPLQALPPLRRVHVPHELVARFEEIALPNTQMGPRGIESCGVLCGHVTNSELYVTHIVIPKQRGDADNCEMLEEDELLQYCIAHNLVTFGWIHTHPSQACFMSSMDQHTQCGYQSTLPEAISVVVAPRDPARHVGIYRLTDSPGSSGLAHIQACTLTGFHPHDTSFPIYLEVGHCVFRPLPFTIEDLRYS